MDVDLSCWFCEAAFARETLVRDAHLEPRRAEEGGPYLRYACPGCRRESHVERNRAGALLGGPPPVVPFADALLATFDAETRAELARKREHAARRAGRREWFFGPYEAELLARGVRPGGGRARGAGERERGAGARDPGPRARGPGGGGGRREEPGRGRGGAREEEPAAGATGEAPGRARAGAAGERGAGAGGSAAPGREGPGGPSGADPRGSASAPGPPAAPRAAHEVLGVAPDADRDTVERAFRELAKRYHPDRFDALDDEFRALAHRRFLELKAARDALAPEPGGGR